MCFPAGDGQPDERMGRAATILRMTVYPIRAVGDNIKYSELTVLLLQSHIWTWDSITCPGLAWDDLLEIHRRVTARIQKTMREGKHAMESPVRIEEVTQLLGREQVGVVAVVGTRGLS